MVEEKGQRASEVIYVPTKISKPTLIQKSIPRNNLFAKFERGIQGVLTTVVSPAGFGKTTSVLAWTNAHDDLPIAWYLLDREDKVIERFWQYLAASMRIADKSLCRSLDEIRLSDDFSTLRPVLDLLLIDLSEYGKDFIFVLEDYHTVHDSLAINESMAYFIKHLPQNAHVVITSRQPVRLPLNKMRVDGLLNEILESDLRFSKDELWEYFYSLGFTLSDERCLSLYQSTQGWPTGSKLIALRYAWNTEAEMDEAILLAKNSINDYLYEEVFAELPHREQHFLLATSTVSSFNLSLAEKITGLSQSETIEVIDSLVASDLFIEKTEREGGKDWYKYHHLFSKMLHQRLERMDREKVEETRLAARDWFDENNYLDYVVEVSSDLKDYEKVRQVIIDNWKTLYMTDNYSTLIRWSSAIPLNDIHKSPMLCAILTMPYAIKGDFEKANSFIQRAISRLKQGEDFLYAFCMAQKTYVSHFTNDLAATSVNVAKALEHLPENEYYLRGMMEQIQAALWIDIDPLCSKQAFMRALDTQIPFGNRVMSSSLYCMLAWVCANLGHIEEAEHYSNLAFSLYDEQERTFKPVLSYAYLSQMLTYYQAGDFEKVSKSFELFQSTSFGGVVPANSSEVLAVIAKVKFATNTPGGKEDFFKAMTTNENGALLCLPSLKMTRAYYEAFKTNAYERITACSINRHARFFDFALMYFVSDEDHYEELSDFIETINNEERLLKLSTLILCAAYSEKKGYSRRAESHFRSILEFVQSTGLYQPLYENSFALESIARRIANRTTDASDMLVLERILNHTNEGNQSFALTQREIDIMRLIASGLTIQDVGSKLFISKDTVKKHLGNVYGKLNVHSKLDAVTILRGSNII